MSVSGRPFRRVPAVHQVPAAEKEDPSWSSIDVIAINENSTARNERGLLADRRHPHFWNHLSVSFDELLTATFLEHAGRSWHV